MTGYTPWLDDGDVRLYHGDALEQLALMPSESVQCIVTSPPFFSLRDYGMPGQIGLEDTPEAWAQRLVDVFREARRVLRSDGVMWLEVGDTYAANRPYQVTDNKHTGVGNEGAMTVPDGMKAKDLMGCPWLLAFALRADGWYLRSDTIWSRPNPMPESVTDRPTKAHSYVFLLTKSARYYYDADSIREDAIHAGKVVTLGAKSLSRGQAAGRGIAASGNGLADSVTVAAGRNARSVWQIATEPTPFAHFATFPQALVERCIKAGTSEHGCCSECGAPWRRVVETTSDRWEERKANGEGPRQGISGVKPPYTVGANTRTLGGWEPTCSGHYAHSLRDGERDQCAIDRALADADRVPCVVLDPFMGSGTTALVARRLGRHAVGVELNAEYLGIAARRLEQLSLLA